MLHIVFAKRLVASTKRENDLHFWWIVTASHNLPLFNLRLGKSTSLHFFAWRDKLGFQMLFQCIELEATFKQHDLLSFHRSNPVVSRLWSSFSYSDCRRSRSRLAEKILKKFFCQLGVCEFVIVPNTKNRITLNRQGKFHFKEEVHALAGAQQKIIDHYELSDLAESYFFDKNCQLRVVAVFRPGSETPFSSSIFNVLQ